ncbi:TAF6-like RNA polymerase II p300/CBP-associated factor-associated factor 65 kDa subunit 6L isoform X2 [Ostrea edulis]|uniref:TAF6-like RNA polymerase II p300/CBP-associated factor-associated factor 65 kDa subunit 6L isoform X2 n=1 Tax=Ostrea edulis TaxID=37623 RepID=UPI0024AF35A5|nr:TAF6-like RNA polymerase II p300/CBP-associated factor-associated factor 65 kDa subunit 6L isoform X2 [Ostrea edulis]
MAEVKEEKKFSVFDDKRYAVITRESIKIMAESVGFSELSDDAAALLCEDVSYRLKEATQNSIQYMKHGKRKRLTTEDFNQALTNSNVQPISGHRCQDGTSFRQTKEGEIFFTDDEEMDLCEVGLDDCTPCEQGETSIKAQWLAVEGITKSASQSQGKPLKQENNDVFLKYYENISKAVLGNDVNFMKTTLQDLRTNPNITSFLPCFVNFISSGVKTISHNVSQMTRLLYTVSAVISNSNLYVEPQPYLNHLVQGVSYCLLEPLAASINPSNDHWTLRDYAARVLAQIVHTWASPINHLMNTIIRNLKEVLCDHAKPFCCHYGAAVGLQALGPQVIDDVLVPQLPVYWPHLTSVLEDNSFSNALTKADAFKVYGALLLSVESLMKTHVKQYEDLLQEKYENMELSDILNQNSGDLPTLQNGNSVSDAQSTISKLYNEMYEYFGDSMTKYIPDFNEKFHIRQKVFTPKLKEKLISLSDADSFKSGEELLKEFMEQVKLQQQLDKEKAEKERIKRLINEEKRARDRKHFEEHQRLMEAGKKRLEEIRLAEIEREREEMEKLKHETRRNKKVAEERISKMLKDDSDDDFGEDAVIPYRPVRKRTKSQVQYYPVESPDSNEDDPSYSLPGTSKGGEHKKGIKLKIITRPGKLPNVKIEAQSKESKKSSPLNYQTRVSPHHKEPKYSPKLSPHVHREAKNSPHSSKEYKSSPHTHKDSPHYAHKDSPEPKYSHHSSLPQDPGEAKHGKKRKISQKRKDEFEFESDPEDFPPMSFKPSCNSSEGESSEGAELRKPIKMKLKVKDSKELTSD